PLEVANVGTVDAELSMSVAVTPDGTTDNATNDLRLTIAHTVGTACDAAVVAADPTPYVASGPVGDAAMAEVDLGGGDSIQLCLAVELPASVTGTGGGSSDVELAFLAEQASI